MKSFSVVVISGPSGSGKSTMLKMLLKDYKDRFAFSVSRKYSIVQSKLIHVERFFVIFEFLLYLSDY